MVNQLVIKKFAHIAEANIDLGDLTVLVGAQGVGKSLVLQWLKAALDGKQIMTALEEAGQKPKSPESIIDLVFGVGMGPAWRKDESRVTFDGRPIQPGSLKRVGDGTERVFFIPAHRAMLISDGWAAPFQKLSADTPVVARLFSQNLFDRFSAREGDRLFPVERVLKRQYRELIDAAVYHGGTIGLEEDQQHSKRLKLSHGASRLPFMTWTAGQREFTPLLLGLYHLLPPRKMVKQPNIDWVVIEEPEMGLHPQAVTVVMLLVLDLLWRGYRVVLSTHSPLVLDVVWALQQFKHPRANVEDLARALGLKSRDAVTKLTAAVGKDSRVHCFQHDDQNRVTSKDISRLDPGSEDAVMSEWGGLTQFGTSLSEADARIPEDDHRRPRPARGKARPRHRHLPKAPSRSRFPRPVTAR